MKYLSEIEVCKKHQFETTITSTHTAVLKVVKGSTNVATIEGLVDDNGIWSFYGLKDVIRNNMLENDAHMASFTITYSLINGEITAETDTDSIDVLFCDDNVAAPLAEDLVLSQFLHSRHAFIAPGMTERLFFIPNAEPSYQKKVVTLIDGQTSTWTTTHLIYTGLDHIDVTMDDTAQYDIEDIVSITITCGSRVITFFAIHDDVQLFRFRNRYNVLETIPLQCGIIQKPGTEFETAMIGNVSVRYDIEHSTPYELATPTIIPQLVEPLLQLVRSHYVEHYNQTRNIEGDDVIGWETIIITDYTLEPSDTHNSPVTFEMTFERANKIETIFLD